MLGLVSLTKREISYEKHLHAPWELALAEFFIHEPPMFYILEPMLLFEFHTLKNFWVEVVSGSGKPRAVDDPGTVIKSYERLMQKSFHRHSAHKNFQNDYVFSNNKLLTVKL